MSESKFLCRMDTLSYALNAAVRVAGKEELAYVRLHRLTDGMLAISALGEDASFRVKVPIESIAWVDDRDDRVEMTKAAARSLAGYEVKTPKDLAVEPTVSITIGEERVRLRDESGLFQHPGGRDEHRLPEPVLPGDHEKIFTDAAGHRGAPFWLPPETLATIASVAKHLHSPVSMIVRSEPEEYASRWYVVGADSRWQLTVSKKEKNITKNPDEPDELDEDPTFSDEVTQMVFDAAADNVRHLVLATPPDGIA